MDDLTPAQHSISAQPGAGRFLPGPPKGWSLAYPEALPIVARRAEIVEAVRNHPVIIVAGETGSGKTTQLPKFCLEAGRGRTGRIACTQPRRVAALSISRRIAEELGVPWGREVGCKIRFSDRTSRDTVVKVMTDGMLLAEVQGDPSLAEYDTVIVDEAHERSLNIDFLLGHLNRLRRARPDLKIIITSATIDTATFSAAFDGAPVIEVSGRLYPVEVLYAPLDQQLEESGEITMIEAAAQTVERIVTEDAPGDVLVFMPGEREIRETVDQLRDRIGGGLEILPLFGRLSAGDQQRVFAPGGARRVIVSTNIAETSLTLPGIRFVVDTGDARISRYNARTRTRRLPVEPISQSSADQRKGRCGRVAGGVCIRLFSEADFLERPRYTPPEILRSNLAEVILRLKASPLGEIESFPFLDAPQPHAIRAGYGLLEELGALDAERQLTPVGRELSRLPVDPTVGRMLLQARRENVLPPVLVIAAGLSIQDPRERPQDRRAAADEAHSRFTHPESDFLTLFNIWEAFHDECEKLTQSRLRKFCRSHFLSFSRMREWRDIHAQLSEVMREITSGPGRRGASQAPPQPAQRGFGTPFYQAVHRSILPGFLAHVARREDNDTLTGTGERKLRIFPGSGLHRKPSGKGRPRQAAPSNRPKKNAEWVVAAELVETTRLYARTVARIDPRWILEVGSHVCRPTHRDPHWCAESGRVLVRESVRLHGLEILCRRVPYGKTDPAAATEIFIRSALVADALEQPHAFLEHNRRLRRHVEAIQTRLRQAAWAGLDEAVYAFYAARLQDVSSIHDLNRVLRDRLRSEPEFLQMKEEDLAADAMDFDRSLFPEGIRLENRLLPLQYAYRPGQPEDGVTLRLSLGEARLLPPGHLDWVVPGLLEEKILSLLRSLPKGLRIQLLPIPEKARLLASVLQPSNRPLASVLREEVRRRYRVEIPEGEWKSAALPEHLRVRMEITDDAGQVLAAGRDADQVRAEAERATRKAAARDPSAGRAWREALARWERAGVQGLDLPELPRTVRVTELNGLPIEAFPGLRPEGDAVAVRLFRTAADAATATRAGLEKLFEAELRYELAWLHKDLREVARIGPLAVTLIPAAQLREHAYEHLRRALCRRSLPELSKAHFAAEAAVAREAARGAVPRLIDRIEAVLQARQQVLLHPSPYTGMPADLERLVPADFLRRTPFGRLADLPRYLRALLIRADRAARAPARESERAALIQGYWQAFARLLEPARPRSASEREGLDELRWMIEEFQVSLFAQELGTSQPVSAVRLDRKIAEQMANNLPIPVSSSAIRG